MAILPAGQGVWLWQIPASGGGRPERIAEEAARQGFSHALIKCADGARTYKTNAAAEGRLCRLLRERGIRPIGWGFHRGGEAARDEAAAAARRCGELGHDAYVLNAEAHWERGEAGAERMRVFLAEFRARTAGRVALGLSTFALPSLHPLFPYKAALAGDGACDFALPQIYTVPGSRRPCLRSAIPYLSKALEELRVFSKPVVPTLRAYTGDGSFDWEEIARDARRFLAAAGSFAVDGWNWWVWQAAESYPDLWQALREGGR